MTDLDTIERLAKLLKASVHGPLKGRKPHWKDVYFVRVKGSRARGIMRDVFVFMSKRRRAQISRALRMDDSKFRVLDVAERKNIVSAYLSGEPARLVARRYGVTRFHVHRLERKFRVDKGV